jgi:DNA-binding response OmpR family regulator
MTHREAFPSAVGDRMNPPKRPRVLYVEDNEDSCQMMSILLDISGIDVACANGIQKAIEFRDKKQFDLFLIDLWLKDGSGTDLCKKLRSEFPDTPVVFYTGCATLQERKNGMLSGAAAYLVKPYSDLVAPIVLRLVNGADLPVIFERPANPLQILEDKATRLVQIMTGSGRALPLSP